MRVLPPRGGSDLYQRVLGSSPRPVLIKISDKKRGEKRREKNLILKRVPWRKTSEEEEGKRKKGPGEKKCKYPQKRRTVECVDTSQLHG